jgi:phosphoglycolate phosphatase
MRVEASRCVYIGDDRRDIEAARAAGMASAAAAWGYIDASDDPRDWGADAVLDEPNGVIDWVMRGSVPLQSS